MQYFIILLSFLLFTGCEKKPSEKDISEKEKKIFNIAVSSDYPPYIYTKDGKLAGFEIEIINAVAKGMERTIHFHDIAFEGIISTVAKRQVDGAISSIARTPEREKEVDFSIPYHRSMTVIVVPLVTSIRGVDDLHDKIIGVEKGTTYENDIKKKFKDIKLFARTKFPELLSALEEGKCQAIVTGYSEAYELQNNNPSLKIIPIEGTSIAFSIALPKGSAWLAPINDKLQRMIKNGDIHKLETQFFKKVIKE